MGCSYTRPGQSGISKCWSEHLQDILNVPVLNLTWKSGGSNSQILREITQYVWNNDVTNTAFIVQWTTIDRTEFCYEDDLWIQVRAQNFVMRTDQKNNAKLSDEQYEISKTLFKAQALSYSTTTFFWEWIQKVLCLDSIMKLNNCKYFQWHMTGTDVNDILLQKKSIQKDFNTDRIFNALASTSWLHKNVCKAELAGSFKTVGNDDPHPNDEGSAEIAKIFATEIKRRNWIIKKD